MSLKTRIEAYTGTLATVATDSIKKSIAKVIELIPVELIIPFTQPVVTSALGVDITDTKVVGGECAGYPAKMVLKAESARYADANSIYFASARCPVFFMSNNKVYTLPAVGVAHVVKYGTVTENDTNIACIPPAFEEAVIVDVAIGELQKSAGTLVRSIATFTLPIDTYYEPVTIPTDLAPADMLWAGATAGSVASNAVAALSTGPTVAQSAGTLNTTLTALSSFTLAPVLDEANDMGVGRVVLTLPTLTAANLASAWSSISTVATPTDVLLDNEMTALNTALTTLNTAMTTDLNSTNEDIELAMARMQQTKTVVDEVVQKSTVLFQRLSSTLEISKLNAVKAYEAQVEKAHTELSLFSAKIQRFQAHAQIQIAEHKENVDTYQVVNATLLNKYQADIAQAQNTAQVALQVWNADVQVKLKNADLIFQAAAETAKMSNDVAVQNAVQTFQAKVSKYSAQLQGVNAHMQKRAADIQYQLSKQAALIAQATEQYKAVLAMVQVLQGRFISFFSPFQKEKS